MLDHDKQGARDAILPELALARAAGQAAPNGLGNWVQLSNAGPGLNVHAQTGTAAGEVCLAALLVTPHLTGFFELDVDVSYSIDTTGVTATWNIVAIPGTAGGIGAIGTGTSSAANLYAGLLAPTPNNAVVLTSDAAGIAANGIGFNGTAATTAHAGAVGYGSWAIPSITGLLTGSAQGFSFHQKGVGAAVPVNPKTAFPTVPVTPNARVCFALTLVIGAAHVLTPVNIAMSAREMPYG